MCEWGAMFAKQGNRVLLRKRAAYTEFHLHLRGRLMREREGQGYIKIWNSWFLQKHPFQSFWVKLSFLGSGKTSPKLNPISIHGVKGINQPQISMSSTLIASVAASTTASKKVVRCPTKLFVFWVDYRTVIICNRQGCHPKRGSGHRCGGERCRWAW